MLFLGSGNFSITLKDCQFLAKAFAASPSEKSKEVVKDLDVQVFIFASVPLLHGIIIKNWSSLFFCSVLQITYEDAQFYFENLGSTANNAINTFGVAFIEAQKDTILNEAKRLYHAILSNIL